MQKQHTLRNRRRRKKRVNGEKDIHDFTKTASTNKTKKKRNQLKLIKRSKQAAKPNSIEINL